MKHRKFNNTFNQLQYVCGSYILGREIYKKSITYWDKNKTSIKFLIKEAHSENDTKYEKVFNGKILSSLK